MKTFTFKELVKQIHKIENYQDRASVWANIDRSFENGRISWDDHELLYDLACMVSVPSSDCRFDTDADLNELLNQRFGG